MEEYQIWKLSKSSTKKNALSLFLDVEEYQIWQLSKSLKKCTSTFFRCGENINFSFKLLKSEQKNALFLSLDVGRVASWEHTTEDGDEPGEPPQDENIKKKDKKDKKR